MQMSYADKVLVRQFKSSLILIAFLGLVSAGAILLASQPQPLQVLGISTQASK